MVGSECVGMWPHDLPPLPNELVKDCCLKMHMYIDYPYWQFGGGGYTVG